MNLIKDVKQDVAELNLDPVTLRKFGLLIGAVFAVIGGLSLVFGSHPVFGGTLLGIGLVLMIWGLAHPHSLRPVYIVWMALAISLGWFVSRLLLVILYYAVLTPISLLGRMSGQRFLKTSAAPDETTNWTPKLPRDPSHMKKMS